MFKGKALFTNANFYGDTSFSGETQEDGSLVAERFERGADFSGVVFGGFADFSGGSFEDDVDFSECEFNRDAEFFADEDARLPGVTFSGVANFTSAHFRGWAGFFGSVFKGKASFNSAKFEDYAAFSDASTFSKTEPSKWLYFHGTKFEGEANFAGAVFALEAQFSGCVFTKWVSFADAKIGSNASFQADPVRNLSGTVFQDEADFTKVDIEGSAFFRGATFFKSASLSEATIRGNAEFGADRDTGIDAATFYGTANFSRLRLDGDGLFQGTWFRQDAIFTGAEIKGTLNFRQDPPLIKASVFAGKANFAFAHFGNECDFNGAKFGNLVSFESARFDGNVDFSGGIGLDYSTNFLRTPVFTNAHFSGNVAFAGANFKDEAYFDQVTVTGSISFNSEPDKPRFTIFEGNFYFREAKVTGTASFKASTFNRSAHFDNSHFGATVDFRGARFVNNASFQEADFHTLYSSTSGRLDEDPNSENQFQDSVDFRGCTYDRIFEQVDPTLNWQALTTRWKPFESQPYVQLEKVIRAVGQDELADRIYLERHTIEREEKWRNKQYAGLFIQWLYWLILNDGMRPPYGLFVISFVLIAGGTYMFSRPGALEPKSLNADQPLGNVNAASTQQTQPVVSQKQPKTIQSLTAAERFWKALGVALRLFSPVAVVMGEEYVPSQRPVGIKMTIFCPVTFRLAPNVYATFFLQIAGWIIVPC